jgi:Rrf2 family protein
MTSEFNIAVHSLVLLANLPDRMATSEKIATNICTHPTRVRKVLALLRKHKYITAKEGAGGGFLLSCDPDKVTLAELYHLTSKGTLKPSWKSGNPESPCGCQVTINIGSVMDSIYEEAERSFEKCLENLTISSVLQKVKEAKAQTEKTGKA